MPIPTDPRTETPSQRRHLVHVLFAGIGMYLLGAYLFIPFAWSSYAKRHPAFDDNPRLTETGDRHPGDPLNVALVGTKVQVDAIMKAANWDPAAALGVKSDLKIAEDTVLKRSDADAPVSNLFLFGRKEDLAFEQPVGGNPRQRNHVRFWKMEKTYDDGQPIWIGAASYDERVGLSHTTGQITHHIAPDIDKERDHLFADLKQSGDLSDQFKINGFHMQLDGHNGGGDRWVTDGALFVGVIKPKLQ